MQVKTVLKLLCLPYILFIGANGGAGGTELSALSVEDVLSGIRMRAELLKSTHVIFQYTVYADHPVEPQRPSFRGLPLVRSREVDIKRLGGKMRVEEKIHNLEGSNTNISHLDIFAWDGEKATGYVSAPWDPNARSSGSVKSKMGGPFKASYWLTPLEQEVFDLRRPLPEILDKARWNLSGPEKIGQHASYCLESVGLWKDGAKLQVWFDPTRDFAPIQIKLTLKFEDGINIVERMSDVRLEQRDGIWIVADAVLTLENPRMKDPRKRRFATRFSVRDYHVGIELSDDVFQVEFPIGTRVYDEILKTGYIVGEGIYVTNEDGSPEFVRNDSLDYKYEMEAPESKLPSPNNIEIKASTGRLSVPDTQTTRKSTASPAVLAKEGSAQKRWPILVAIFAFGCVLSASAYVYYKLAWRK